MTLATIQADQLLDSLKWRYAVKKFDSSRTIDKMTWAKIEHSLILTPSSFGLQPWKFIVIQSPEMKAKLPSISWNQTQPADCSAMVVFAALNTVSADYVDKFLAKTAATRGVPIESLDPYRKVVLGFIKNITGHELAWSSKQAYIALGQLMTSAAMLGVDACPMEGIVASEYDKLLGLEGTAYSTVVGCAVGYRHADDKYAIAPKVRFEIDDVITHV